MTFKEHIEARGYWEGMPNVVVDYDNEVVTFLLFTTTGTFAGYQNYHWRADKVRGNLGRYFTWLTEWYRLMGVWGWHSLTPQSGDFLFVCEGIWDAIRIHNAGYPAIAIMTATPHPNTIKYVKLNTCSRKLIGVLDRDENRAGEKLGAMCDRKYTVPPPFKDIGEMEPGTAKAWLEDVLYATGYKDILI